MKLFAPAYYQGFACIADKCRHSCCIGWEIDVDEDTLALYDSLEGDYASAIRQSIDRTDVPHFSLAALDRCPHLDEQGLCRIIRTFGHGALCEICREHPRFYHQTPLGTEVGLGLACEEACRIVLDSDAYAEMIELEELDGEPAPDAFDAVSVRAQIYALLSDRTTPYAARLQALQTQFGIVLTTQSDAALRALLASMEYLDGAHRALFDTYSANAATPPEAQALLERALAYFIFRHASDACDRDDLRARLGLSLFLERLLCSMIRAGHDPYDAARILSEEIEYSEDNTASLIFEYEAKLI